MDKEQQIEEMANGYFIENNKIVYFSNMLGECRNEKTLQEVCEELNNYVKKFDSYCQQIDFYKAKAEENKANLARMTDNYNAILKQCAHLRQALAERENYIASLQKFTSEVQVKAVKEFAERVKLETTVDNRLCVREYDIGYNDGYSEAYYSFHKIIDGLLKEYEK